MPCTIVRRSAEARAVPPWRARRTVTTTCGWETLNIPARGPSVSIRRPIGRLLDQVGRDPDLLKVRRLGKPGQVGEGDDVGQRVAVEARGLAVDCHPHADAILPEPGLQAA
jgi:hypothetical protein